MENLGSGDNRESVIRRSAVLVLLGLGVAMAPSASGAPERSVPIRLGVGIGPNNLGMSGQQVRQALGRPRAVIERRVIRGIPYVEFEYRFGEWNVGLLGRKGTRRVVVIGTGLARHRTPEGIGVNSTEDRLVDEYRGLRRRGCGPGNQWALPRGRTDTLFSLDWRTRRIIGIEIQGTPMARCGP
jgi:hypothetical protein